MASVALVGILVWRTNWHSVGVSFARLRLELWLLGATLYVLSQVVSSLRWQFLARPLGFQRPFRDFVHIYFIGMFFNLALPTSVGGDVARVWYLDNRSGRRALAFSSVIRDRLNGLLVMLAIACLATVIYSQPLPPWIPWAVWGSTGAVLAGLTMLPIAVRYRLVGKRHEGLIRELLRSPLSVFAPWPLTLSGVVQASNVLLVWLIGQAIGAPIPDGYYWIVVPLVSLASLLPISVNGIGVRESCMILLLKPVGVDDGTALALTLLWFGVTTAVSLSGIGFYLLGQFPRFEVNRHDRPVSCDSDQGRAGQSEAAA